MAYGIESVIPAEVGMPTCGIEAYHEEQNNDELCTELDLVEEKRAQACIRVSAYQQVTARYYNSRVKEWRFKEGELVLKSVFLFKLGF